MKLTDFLQDVGRPVAYYPSLRRITGSTNATILLCQFIYWKGKESDPEGWLYKESTEIEKETGLSYEEQKGARKKLVESGLIEEHYARLDHQMKFRLNLDAIDSNWGIGKSPIPEQGNPSMGNEEIPCSLNESESTTENTAELSGFSKSIPEPSMPKGDLVDAVLQYEQKPTSIRTAIKEYFRLNVNWETKTARQWMEWAVSENITPDQIARAADLWRTDKQFNWSVPTLKGIFEKWPMLNSVGITQKTDVTYDKDGAPESW